MERSLFNQLTKWKQKKSQAPDYSRSSSGRENLDHEGIRKEIF